MSATAAILAGAVLVAAASPTPTARPQDAFAGRASSQLVEVFVTVADEDGPIRAARLEREAFALADSGVPQRIVTFSTGDVPYSAMLVLDASESMRGKSLALAKEATRRFVERADRFDEVAWLAFSDRPLAYAPADLPLAERLQRLEAVEPGGSTAMYDALLVGAMALEERLGHKAVILVSDGTDLCSSLGPEDVEKALQLSRAQLFWIRPQPAGAPAEPMLSSWRTQEQARADLEGLERVVESTGGLVLPIAGYTALGRALDRVREVLRNQVAIGYAPDPPLGSGTFRPWAVELRGAPAGVRLLVPSGFFDVGPEGGAAGHSGVP